MALDDAQAHREPEARAAHVGLGREERVEDPVEVLGGDAGAGVAELHQHLAVGDRGAHAEDPHVRHGIERVVHDVDEDLLQPGLVHLRQGQLGRVVLGEGDVVDRALAAHHGQGLAHDGIEVGGLRRELVLAREVEQVAHDVAGPPRFLLDQVQLLPHRLARPHLLGEVRRKSEDRGQRVVDLVGHVRGQLPDGGELGGLDELGLRLLQLLEVPLDALVEPGVLDAEGRRARDALEQPDLLGRELPPAREPEQEKAADRLALDDHGHEQHRPVREAGDRLLVHSGVVLDVGGVARLARAQGFLQQVVAREGNGCRQEAVPLVLRHVVAGNGPQVGPVGVGQVGSDGVRPQRPPRLPRDAPQRLGGVERGPDGLADREERLGGAQPLLRLLVQPRVLHRDRDLVGDELEELLFVRPRPRRYDVARREHPELVVAYRQGQAPLHLAPVVGGEARLGEHAAGAITVVASRRHLRPGARQVHGEAGAAEGPRHAGEQLLEQRRHAQLGGHGLHGAVQVLELARPPHEVTVEPLQLLDLVEEAVDEALVQLAEVDPLLQRFDALALAEEELRHLAREHVDVDGFLYVAVAAGHERALPVPLHGVRGDRDDRRVGEVGERLQDPHRLVAVHPGQVHVEEDERGPLADGRLDARQAVVGRAHRVALGLQHRASEHAVLGVVLDVQDLRRPVVAARPGVRHGRGFL